MKDWWLSLRPREQLIVIVGSGAIVIALIFLIVIEPFLEESASLSKRIEAKHQDLTWMQQASKEIETIIGTAKGRRPGGNRQSLLSVIDNSARRNRIRKPIQRMEPEGSNGVKVWIENAEFDKLIVWLGQLDEKHGVNVTRATISRKNSPGLVDTRLSLQR